MDMELHKVLRKISIGVKKIIDLNTEFLAKAKTCVWELFKQKNKSTRGDLEEVCWSCAPIIYNNLIHQNISNL